MWCCQCRVAVIDPDFLFVRAGLPKQSVVNVTQIFTVNKMDLVEKIGSLSRKRMAQILEGIMLVMTPGDVEE